MKSSSEHADVLKRALQAHQQGRWDQAESLYLQILQYNSEHPDAVHFLGLLALQRGDHETAHRLITQSIRLNPAAPHFHNNLGELLRARRRLTDAAQAFATAISLDPRHVPAHNNLGNVLKDLGDARQAVECFKTALSYDPHCAVAHSNLLLCLLYLPDAEPDAIFAEHVRWDRMHGRELAVPDLPARRINGDGRIRVGYVSPDFRDHAVSYFIEPVLARHDSGRFEIFCYSDVRHPDATTQRIRNYNLRWREISALPDRQLAELIRSDGIDILVDLAGHTAGNRLRMFSIRQAPIQITYLGYQATTGIKAMDYRLADSFTSPVGIGDERHTETVVRLGQTFACYRPPEDCPPVGDLPAARTGRVTFASTAVAEKISPLCVGWWSRVLATVPNSRLLMIAFTNPEPAGDERLRRLVDEAGIDPQRVEFRRRLPMREYLALHQEIDIILDTFPFTGHTTSCHALWMGVPVVTLAGRSFVSRMGHSVLSNLALPELIAQTPEQFVEIAAALAQDLSRLSTLRAALRDRMRQSPVLDAVRFTQNLEDALMQMWNGHAAT